MGLRHKVATVYSKIDVQVPNDALDKVIHLVDDCCFEKLLKPQQICVQMFIYSDGTIEISGEIG